MNRAVIIAIGALTVWYLFRKPAKSSPRIYLVDHLPANLHAATLPPYGIFILTSHQANGDLLNHELIHWQQYERLGILPYYFNYVTEYLARGYDAHRMEREARFNESVYCQDHYTQCVRTGLARTVYDPAFGL